MSSFGFAATYVRMSIFCRLIIEMRYRLDGLVSAFSQVVSF